MSYVEWANKAIKEAFKQESLELESDLLPFYSLLLLVAGKSVTMKNVHDAQVCCMQQRKNSSYRFIPFSSTEEIARGELEKHRRAIERACCTKFTFKKEKD